MITITHVFISRTFVMAFHICSYKTIKTLKKCTCTTHFLHYFFYSFQFKPNGIPVDSDDGWGCWDCCCCCCCGLLSLFVENVNCCVLLLFINVNPCILGKWQQVNKSNTNKR